MVAEVRGNNPGIGVIEHALALDLLRTRDGRVAGLTLHVIDEGQHDGVGAVLAPVVVLATGGIGQVFNASTNPAVATGDGVALGLRAGASVADMEFIQFHPPCCGWVGSPSASSRWSRKRCAARVPTWSTTRVGASWWVSTRWPNWRRATS